MQEKGLTQWQERFKRWRMIVWSGWFAAVGVMLAGPVTFGLQQLEHRIPDSARQTASHISGDVWKYWLASTLPQPLAQSLGETGDGQGLRGLLHVAVKEITTVDWNDPRSVFALEMPWLQEKRDQLLWGQAWQNYAPVEIDPAPELAMAESDNPIDRLPPLPKGTLPPTPTEEPNVGTDSTEGKSADRNEVLIYHTHNRESWLPELKGVTKADKAYHSQINVTLLGRRLQKLLDQRGVEAIHVHPDYPTDIPAFQYHHSYRYSSETIRSMVSSHQRLSYFIDIHRDSQNRNRTTFVHQGKAYAQIYLIIGKKNPNWKQNMQFARTIHEGVEAVMPGLSRGVWSKGEGNGEYNQSVSPNSVLIEIGGVENSLRECNRTLEVLAPVLAGVVGKQSKQQGGQ